MTVIFFQLQGLKLLDRFQAAAHQSRRAAFHILHLALQEPLGQRSVFTDPGRGKQVGITQFVRFLADLAHLDAAVFNRGFR
jgi:hypothetical protein